MSDQDEPGTPGAKPVSARKLPETGLREIGLREIGQRAQVTKMTVSRALRTPSKVAPATMRRIEAAIEELGYVPNQIAGSLATRSSGIVLVVVPTMAGSIFSDFIDEISTALDQAGFIPLLACSNFDNTYEERLLRRYLGWQPNAIVLTGAGQSSLATDLCRRARIPVVQTWSLPEKPIGYVVGFSNFRALYEMVRALHGWGYHRIGFGFVDTPNNDRSWQRRLGWETAVREAGDDPLPTRTGGGRMAIEFGAEILRGILERHPDTDAIAFGSDVLAAGAVLECRRLGISVPDQLAITGCGDMGLATIVTPGLTTVRLPGRAMGRACADMLTQVLDGRYDGARIVELDLSIVRRESA